MTTKPKDLIQRLRREAIRCRRAGGRGGYPYEELEKAAATIEELLAENTRLQESRDEWKESYKTRTQSHVEQAKELFAEIKELRTERDEARTELDDIKESTKFVMSEDCPTDEMHCGCVPIIRAQNRRLRETLQWIVDEIHRKARLALEPKP